MGRWARWFAVWAALALLFGLVTPLVVGPLLPAAFVWAGAAVLASGLTLLLMPSPHDE